MARLGWAFDCFAGGIVWFLRPYLARAKYVRFKIEQIQAKAALAAIRRGLKMAKEDARVENTANNQAARLANADLLKELLKTYLDIYKHHFDLFVKAGAGYLASVAFVTGIIFSTTAEKQTKAVLCVSLCGGSILAVFGAFLSLYWVLCLEREVRKISSDLGVGMFPFIGAKLVTWFLVALAMLFFVLAAYLRRSYAS
jgi:hypothetical protein